MPDEKKEEPRPEETFMAFTESEMNHIWGALNIHKQVALPLVRLMVQVNDPEIFEEKEGMNFVLMKKMRQGIQQLRRLQAYYDEEQSKKAMADGKALKAPEQPAASSSSGPTPIPFPRPVEGAVRGDEPIPEDHAEAPEKNISPPES